MHRRRRENSKQKKNKNKKQGKRRRRRAEPESVGRVLRLDSHERKALPVPVMAWLNGSWAVVESEEEKTGDENERGRWGGGDIYIPTYPSKVVAFLDFFSLSSIYFIRPHLSS